MFSKIDQNVLVMYAETSEGNKLPLTINRENFQSFYLHELSPHFFENLLHYPTLTDIRYLAENIWERDVLITDREVEVVSENMAVLDLSRPGRIGLLPEEEKKKLEAKKALTNLNISIWKRKYDYSSKKVYYQKVVGRSFRAIEDQDFIIR